jgi:ERF superfamily
VTDDSVGGSSRTVYDALLNVQRALPGLSLGRDAEGQVGGSRKYWYLSLNKLMDVVLPVLNENELVWITEPGGTADEPLLHYRLRLVGNPETALDQEIKGVFPLMLEKQNSQGVGSALTYARRYVLTAVLGLTPDEDDDGAAASVTERPRQHRAPQVISREQRVAMVDEIEAAGLDLSTTLQLANIDTLQRVDAVQAKRVRKIIDEAKMAAARLAVAPKAVFGSPERE